VSKKRIALLTDNFNTGGGLEHLFQIVKGLPHFDFGIFAKQGDAQKKFLSLSHAKLFDKGFRPKTVTEFEPDLIHIHHLKPLLMMLKNPLRHYDIPVFFTAHGLHIHKYEFLKGRKNRIEFKIRLNLEKYLYNQTDLIIALSKGDMEYLRTNYKINSVKYISNGIDPNEIYNIKNDKQSLRIELNLPEKSFLFLTVARFNFQKGYDILINAIKVAAEEFRENKARFIIIGNGDEFDFMNKLADRSGISSLISFLGTRTDIYKFMKACDAFLLPSRWEGLPISPIEASFSELPVIASRTYGNNEIIEDQKTGILFQNENPNDLSSKLLGFLNGDYDLEGMAHQAHREAKKKYQLEDMLSHLNNLYLNKI